MCYHVKAAQTAIFEQAAGAHSQPCIQSCLALLAAVPAKAAWVYLCVLWPVPEELISTGAVPAILRFGVLWII